MIERVRRARISSCCASTTRSSGVEPVEQAALATGRGGGSDAEQLGERRRPLDLVGPGGRRDGVRMRAPPSSRCSRRAAGAGAAAAARAAGAAGQRLGRSWSRGSSRRRYARERFDGHRRRCERRSRPVAAAARGAAQPRRRGVGGALLTALSPRLLPAHRAAPRACGSPAPATPPTTAFAGTSLVTTALVPTTRCRRRSRRAGCRRRSRSRRCARRRRRACRCPAARIGRSTSVTPWSKSISMTRSAMMHSRPIETCWKAEIVHSWPITVFAPMLTSPSCTRILQPCPIHAQRPIRSVALAADLELHAGADEAQPVGLQAPAEAQLEPRRSARAGARSRGRSMWLARMKRSSASGPPCSGPGARRTRRARPRAGVVVGVASASSSIAANRKGASHRRASPSGSCDDAPLDDRGHRSPSACSTATAVRWRARSRSSRTTGPRAGSSCARSTRTPARPRWSASRARPAWASRR